MSRSMLIRSDNSPNASAPRRRGLASASMDRALASVDVDSVSVAYGRGPDAVHDVSLSVRPGSILALLGPSGCGKTSLLRAIAGLERPRAGTISIAGTTVSSPSSWVKPEHRHIGMVFQDGALFPHLTVADNVAFGLTSTSDRPSRADRHARVAELLELVDLAGVGDRLPDTLSGGQQQRVALARSLAPNPSVLLLDEPFSALDAGLRIHVRAEVARILREVGVTSVFVTHDQDEAFVLGDRVAVMRDGRVEQIGTPDELYRTPQTRWVAGFVGEANFVPGLRAGDRRTVDTALGPVPIDASAAELDGEVAVLIRPEQVELSPGDDAEITTVEYYGHDVRYELRLADGTMLSARTHPDQLHQRGERVAISFEPSATTTAFRP
jgi:iron(III) transport system ATP-binding protein